MLARLQAQKQSIEERATRLEYEAKVLQQLRPKLNQPGNSAASEAQVVSGPKLPVGIIGFGRTGTWIADDNWRPEFIPSTNELPTIRRQGEEQEVQDSLLSKATEEDLSRNPDFRMLTLCLRSSPEVGLRRRCK